MSFISKLMGGESPAPAPLPVAPSNDDAAKKARDDAELAAAAESRANGRRSTMVAGARSALEARSQRVGAASTTLG